MLSDDQLAAKGVVDISAAKVYLFVLENGYDTTKVNISKADIMRIGISDPISEEVENRYKEYRELFRGSKESAIGDKNLVIKNLVRFMKETKKSFDEVLLLASEYVHANLGNPYIRRADYALYKWEKGKEVQPLIEFEQSKSSLLSNNIII